MKKEDRELIKHAREDMDDNPVSKAVFKIQTIIEEVYQCGIDVGEGIGYAKAMLELNKKADDIKPMKKSCKKTSKGDK